MGAANARRYDATWSVIEKRHGWSIAEQEMQNRKVANSLLTFAFQDYDNRRAVQFRQQHKLEELVATAADDWEAALRLRHWTFNNIRNGVPSFESIDPLAFIPASQAGGTFWCTYYAYAFVAAASSLGHPARHMGVDCDRTLEEPGSHHGVVDVWVNKFRKWVALDPHYDLHYELDGVPLNAEEIAQVWITRKGAGVKALIGPERREVPFVREIRPGVHESCGYFWFYIDLNCQVFQKLGQPYPDPAAILLTPARKDRIWYQGKEKHCRYAQNSFVPTERYNDVYPELNCVELEPSQRPALPYCSPVRIWTGTVPNFSHFEVSIDGGAPFRYEGIEFPWQLHPGNCSLMVRTVNLGGQRGPESRISLRIEAAR
ncbi:MAG TPA: transglutaminase domain-containing protein [Planctomycetota bacterium]|nr:transglutaminase domain-containing protein [Planctomycetota bacterium]